MKIAHAEIMPVDMPKDDPEWGFALAAEPTTQVFVTKLTTDDGVMGLGYTAAFPHRGASYRGIQAALEAYTELLIGQDPFNTEKISGMMNRVLRRNNEAKAAIDVALHDVQAKIMGLPLNALLGGLVREQIPIIRVLALKEPSQMAANALTLVEQGYAYIKAKLSGDPAKDLTRVKEIRKAVGESIHLAVDANQTYSPKLAIDTLKRMGEYGVELCEQPVKEDDWQGLAAVTRAVDCDVEAHESASTLENIFGLVKDRVVDSIFLAVAQLGGLRNAKVAAELCKLGNVAVRVGAIGSRILAAASMHLVSSTENISYACQLGEFSRLKNDPAHGLEVKNGMLKVPSSPGIGVSLRS